MTRNGPHEAHSTCGTQTLKVLMEHSVLYHPLKIQARTHPSSRQVTHFLSLSTAGCTLRGGGSCIHWRTPSKHCPGASGRRSAAMEASGAGAEEDSLRPAQDAQLDDRHVGIREPGHGCQLLGLDRANDQFPSLIPVSLGLPFKSPWHLPFSLSSSTLDCYD